MQSFVRLTYTVTRYVLYQTGMLDCICMHMPKESRDLMDFETKSNNSYISGGKKKSHNKSQAKSALSQYFHKKEQRRKSQMNGKPENFNGNIRTPTRLTDRESEISSNMITMNQSHSGFKVIHNTNDSDDQQDLTSYQKLVTSPNFKCIDSQMENTIVI